ncbi:MAG: DUF3631 domain-containing protein [Nakamurella sp.]
MSAPVVPATPIVDGAALLDELAATFDRFVVTPSAAARDGIVLWTAATHAQQSWNYAPRLVINSPEKRCGKTRLLEVIAGTAHQPRMTANISTAALFRMIGAKPPTIIVDEADTMFGTRVKADQNEDLRGLLNAGHSRAATTWRCVGPQQEVREFPVFAMAALAGIGQMPDTITDRALNVTMRRRTAGETVQPYRQRRDGEALAELRDRIADWLADHLDQLEEADPRLPVEDRAADNWSPLVALADLAGGTWPGRARKAAVLLTGEHNAADAAESLNVQLLQDIARLRKDWSESFIGSAKLAAQLRSDDTAPWGELDLTPRRLFTRLRGFGIAAGHNSAKTERGYRIADFDDAIARYLPDDDTPSVQVASGNVQASETTPDLRQPADAREPTDVSIRPPHPERPRVSAGQSPSRTLGHNGTHTSQGDEPHPAVARSCGHSGDPATRCGTCVAERANRQGVHTPHTPVGCRVCDQPADPDNPAGLCGLIDADHRMDWRTAQTGQPWPGDAA